MEFIDKSNTEHNSKYDYSLVNYVNNRTKVKIICPEHGVFEQQPNNHISGNGCPVCGRINKKSDDEYVLKFNIIHNKKYNYSLFKYVNAKTKIKIICPEHDVFEQRIDTHLSGKGCPICAGNIKSDLNSFIGKSNIKHNTFYNYSLVDYINNATKVKIICPNHGVFVQTPNSHLSGKGCKKCSLKTNNDFIVESNLTHNNYYDYSFCDYKVAKTKVNIICPEHGVFEQTPDAHIRGSGCPNCSLRYNKSEDELKLFIKTLDIDVINNSKTIIPPLELDIYIPSANIAIEYNGLYWHSELYKPNNYHFNKTNECEKQGIQLIHIFEDEWLYKKDIVKSRLKNILGLTSNKIYARKCIIKDVSPKESKEFLENNHLQGSVNSKIKIGLYYNDELVSLMTFNSLRKNKTYKNGIELTRFCNKIDTSIIGGADKLLQYFIKTYNYREIISYADRRWSQGSLYDKLGFNFIHNSKPNHYYIINNKRRHKSNFKKKTLIKNGYEHTKSEKIIMFNRKIYRIYDCGLKKYVLLIT